MKEHVCVSCGAISNALSMVCACESMRSVRPTARSRETDNPMCAFGHVGSHVNMCEGSPVRGSRYCAAHNVPDGEISPNFDVYPVIS